MCEQCYNVEPQTQNTDDTNIGMIEGYAQDIVDLCGDWRTGDFEGGKDRLLEEVKDKVAYLHDHMAAI